MIKSIVLHDIPMSHIAAMERWYYKDHAPEICRRYAPWLTRHESYLPVDAPPEARAYGFYNWRVTEGCWRELPEPGPKGTFSFTVPPVWPKVATCFVPAQPTEDFMGYEFQPHEKTVLRWYLLFKYPAGVSREEGENWFLNVHVKEVMKQLGLYRFFSYRVIKERIPLPGTWAPYETFDDWRTSVIDSPPQYTKPSWARYDRYPFLEPSIDFICSFILERPNDEFLRDARGYL
jgi:hypothetical protein